VENYEFPALRKGIFYWVIAQHQGRSLIIGPKMSEDDAYRTGFEKLDGNFEVVALPTRDRAKAVAMMKNKLLDKTANVDEATRRFKHG